MLQRDGKYHTFLLINSKLIPICKKYIRKKVINISIFNMLSRSVDGLQLYVSHLLQTLTMDSGGPFYVHISYIFYSGELQVVYMSLIYYKHLPRTVVVHFTYTSPTYYTVVSSRWSICLTFIRNTYHGQWWSILCTHPLHILQW